MANWKTYFSYHQTIAWLSAYKQSLLALAKNHTILICPSFDALAFLANELQKSSIMHGAQDCSDHNSGAYTGQVLAKSLYELGCNYCIIGHSESSTSTTQNPDSVAQKAINLLENRITPIICVGESKFDFDLNKGRQVIEQQLICVIKYITKHAVAHKHIAIAYEPLWMIGGNSSISSEYIIQQLELITHVAKERLPNFYTSLLYGGSVDEITISKYKDIPLLDGVLIGKASTDFQRLEKIVLL